MSDPNNYQTVKIVTNPVKPVVCQAVFTEDNTTAECKLYKDLMDLTTGVWLVAVDSVIIVNKSRLNNPIKGIFEIKTNLGTCFKQVQNTPVVTEAWLATIEVQNAMDEVQFVKIEEKNYFTVTTKPSSSFMIHFSPHVFSPVKNYRLAVEVRLLFQRTV